MSRILYKLILLFIFAVNSIAHSEESHSTAIVISPDQTSYSPEDLYHILGIDRNASDKEITQAYRKLWLKYHPDRLRAGEKPPIEYAKISEAYAILHDLEARQQYDHYGNAETAIKIKKAANWFQENKDLTQEQISILQKFADYLSVPFEKGGPGFRISEAKLGLWYYFKTSTSSNFPRERTIAQHHTKNVRQLEEDFNKFKNAFEFMTRPVSEHGLELTPKNANALIKKWGQYSSFSAHWENLDTPHSRVAHYQKWITSPIEEGGLGLKDKNEIWKEIESIEKNFKAPKGLEYIEFHKIYLIHALKPISKGGLGLPSEEAMRRMKFGLLDRYSRNEITEKLHLNDAEVFNIQHPVFENLDRLKINVYREETTIEMARRAVNEGGLGLNESAALELGQRVAANYRPYYAGESSAGYNLFLSRFRLVYLSDRWKDKALILKMHLSATLKDIELEPEIEKFGKSIIQIPSPNPMNTLSTCFKEFFGLF